MMAQSCECLALSVSYKSGGRSPDKDFHSSIHKALVTLTPFHQRSVVSSKHKVRRESTLLKDETLEEVISDGCR